MGEFLAFLSACGYTTQVVFITAGTSRGRAYNSLAIQLVIVFSTIVTLYLVTLAYVILFPGHTLFEDFVAMQRPALLMILCEGFFASFLGLFFITKATEMIGPTKASTLRCCNPLFTTIFSMIILRENPGFIGFTAVVVLMLGILTVTYRKPLRSAAGENMEVLVPVDGQEGRRQELLGSLFALLSGLSFSLSQTARGVALTYGATPLIIALLSLPFTFVFMLILFRISSRRLNIFAGMSMRSIKWFSLGGVGSLVGNLSLSQAFVFIPVWQAVAIRNTQPLIAILMSALLLKKQEKITPATIAGAILVITGALLSLF